MVLQIKLSEETKKILRYEIEEKWYEEGWLICI